MTIFGVTQTMADESEAVGNARKVMPKAGAHMMGRDRMLEAGANVHRNEQLWTSAGGRLEIVLGDGSIVDLGENGRLMLDDFVLPENRTGSLVLRNVSGALRFVGGAIDKSASARVKIVTPVATLVVRGTDFFAGPIDGAYGVFVFHGKVEVATSQGSVSLTDGEGTTMKRSSDKPSPVKRWGNDKIARAEKLVGF